MNVTAVALRTPVVTRDSVMVVLEIAVTSVLGAIPKPSTDWPIAKLEADATTIVEEPTVPCVAVVLTVVLGVCERVEYGCCVLKFHTATPPKYAWRYCALVAVARKSENDCQEPPVALEINTAPAPKLRGFALVAKTTRGSIITSAVRE